MVLTRSRFLASLLKLCVFLTLNLLLITCSTTRVQHGLDNSTFKTISSINDAVLAISSINAMSTSSTADKQAIAKYLSIITRLEGQFKVVGVADTSYTSHGVSRSSIWTKFRHMIVVILSLTGAGTVVFAVVAVKRSKRKRDKITNVPYSSVVQLGDDSVIESTFHTISEK